MLTYADVYWQGNYEEAAEAFEKVMDLSQAQPQLVYHTETGESAVKSSF
jgi:hypothetical protein